MLTPEEMTILSQIAIDEATGKHLIRTEDEWNILFRELNVTRTMYELISKNLNLAKRHFSWQECDDSSEYHAREILLYYKCCQDKEFMDIVLNMYHYFIG